VLTHHIAVEDCKKKAKEDACDLLKKNVVDEVVAICHRRCTPKTEGEADGARQAGEGYAV
jgi:hypothetical protein